MLHRWHILPPSEIDLGLFLAVFAGSEGKSYSTELAERVEYGSYALVCGIVACALALPLSAKYTCISMSLVFSAARPAPLRPIHLLRVVPLRVLGARFGGRHLCHPLSLRVSSRSI